jgi:hypothetical protein
VEVFPLPLGTPACLFFHPQHLSIQTRNVIYSFILTSNEDGGILAFFNCCKCSDVWISPPAAPFGGMLLQRNCSKPQLDLFLNCILEWLRGAGAKKLVVKTAPLCYYPDVQHLCHESYLEAGFFPNHTYSNHYIPIDEGTFYQLIERTEKRRLSKGKTAGFPITIQRGPVGDDARNFLEHNYIERGYELPLSADRLAEFASIFPDSFVTFKATHRGKLVAVLIAVKVTPAVIYHFMSGYLPEYAAFSPSVLLFEALYEFCQQEGFSVLDLGISIDNHGNAKPSLSRFKTNIGGLECPKVIYEVEL